MPFWRTLLVIVVVTGLVVLVILGLGLFAAARKWIRGPGSGTEGFAQEKDHTRRPPLAVAMIAIVGVALSVALAGIAYQSDRDHRRQEFAEFARPITDTCAEKMRDLIDDLGAVRSFYDSSKYVDRQEFRQFTALFLDKRKCIQALEWIPRVPRAERERFETEALAEGLKGFRFTEMDGQGHVVTAGERAEYFPVYYLEPHAGNESAAGFDLASGPTSMQVLEQARDQGVPVVAADIPLFEETGLRHRFLVLQPVYRQGTPLGTPGDRRANLQGFVVGVFLADALLDAVLGTANRDKMVVELRDLSAPAEKQLLCAIGEASPSETLTVEHRFEFAGRQWAIVCRPTPGSLAAQPATSWVVLAAGLLLTALLTVVISGRERRLRLVQSLLEGKDIPELKRAIRIRGRILVPVAVGVCVLVATFLAWFRQDAYQEGDAQTRMLARQAEHVWRELLVLRAALLREHMDDLEEAQGFASSFQHRDRQELLARADPYFYHLRDAEGHGITHLYFVDPDRTCFLRVHQPSRFGDVIHRATMKQAALTGEDTWGVELGALGTFVLRYVRPWRVQGDMIGFLELAMEVKSTAEQIHDILGDDVVLVVRKDATTKDAFEAGRKAGLLSGDWDAFDDVVVLSQSVKEVPRGLAAYLKRATASRDESVFRVAVDGRDRSCQAVPIRDAAGRHVAELVVMRDIMEELGAQRRALTRAVFGAAGLTALLLMGLWLATGGVENRLTAAVIAREREEEALRVSGEKLRTVMTAAQDAIVMMDHEGNVSMWNAAAERLFGYTAGEVLGRSLHRLVMPAHQRAAYEQGFARFRQTGEGAALGKVVELTALREDRSEFPVEISVSPVRVGNQWHAVGIVRDITERKRADQALRESETRFRIASRSVSDLVWEWDIPTERLDWFGNIDEMLGCAPGEFPRTIEAWEGIIHPEDRTRVNEVLDRHLKQREPYDTEYRVMTQEGTVRHWTDRGVASWDETGRAFRMVGACSDITERKRAEEELKETNRRLEHAVERANEMAVRAEAATCAKSVFLANMSHEIRTPMTAILGFADVLLEEGDLESAPPERIEAAKTIKRNCEHLLGLINDILDLSKIEAGRFVVERVPCSPCEVVAEIASLMRIRSESKGVRFDVKYEGPVPERILSDPTRLRQILINLLGNAIKFTEAGSVRMNITCVTGQDHAPRLQFDVIDTGVGMTEEQVAKLFQPFMQADASTTRRFGGTGLGLAVSRRLAELLGGDVTLVKTREGAGTRMRVTVPTGPLDGVPMIQDPRAATVVVPDGTAAKASADPPALQDCRVLLAEDGPDNQRLIRHVLKRAGAEVTLVENGKQAVEAALAARQEGRPFDVILMDMQMPVLDGYAATGLLRQRGYTGPIVALTAHAMAGDRERCLEAGCSDYATKPVDRRKLIETIRQNARPSPVPA